MTSRSERRGARCAQRRGSVLGLWAALAIAALCGDLLAQAPSAFAGVSGPVARSRVGRVPRCARKKSSETPNAREELRKELQDLAKSLGAEDTASNVGLVATIRSKVLRLKATADGAPNEAEAVRALEERLQKMEADMTEAEIEAMEAQMRAEGCEVDLLMPINSELNVTKTQLREAKGEAADLQARVESLEASLAAADARIAQLTTGLKEIGSASGVGGPGGFFLVNLMSDLDLIKDIKSKILGMKKKR